MSLLKCRSGTSLHPHGLYLAAGQAALGLWKRLQTGWSCITQMLGWGLSAWEAMKFSFTQCRNSELTFCTCTFDVVIKKWDKNSVLNIDGILEIVSLKFLFFESLKILLPGNSFLCSVPHFTFQMLETYMHNPLYFIYGPGLILLRILPFNLIVKLKATTLRSLKEKTKLML